MIQIGKLLPYDRKMGKSVSHQMIGVCLNHSLPSLLLEERAVIRLSINDQTMELLDRS